MERHFIALVNTAAALYYDVSLRRSSSFAFEQLNIIVCDLGTTLVYVEVL